MKYPYKHKVRNGSEYAPRHSREYFYVEVRKTKNGYNGVFAGEDIPKGSVVGRTGGVVLSSIADLPQEEKYDYPVLIDENVFLGPEDFTKLETFSFLNHSCSPNLGRIGGSTLVAKRRIRKGQEITIDYAPFIAGMKPKYRLKCRCGSKKCRKHVNSDDWKDRGIAKALWGEWLPFIQKRILRHKKRR